MGNENLEENVNGKHMIYFHHFSSSLFPWLVSFKEVCYHINYLLPFSYVCAVLMGRKESPFSHNLWNSLCT